MQFLSDAAWLSLPALLGLVLFLAGHLLVWQWLARGRKGVLTLLAVAIPAYLLSTVACAVVWHMPVTAHFWTTAPCYAFLVVLYFHFYFAIDRSLSIRILGELARSESGTLSLADLDSVYPKADMIARRLAVLEEKGVLAQPSPGFYVCTQKGMTFVWFARFGKRLYNLDATG